MSCLMYQPYASYFPYQRPTTSSSGYTDSIKKFHASLDKVQDGLHNHHCSPYPSPLTLGHHPHNVPHTPSGLMHASASLSVPPQSTPPSGAHPKQEHSQQQDKTSSVELPKDTQYLSANCVVYSYFNGDIANSVDEHFTRSLTNNQSGSQHNSNSSSPHENAGVDKKSNSWKSSTPPIPMAQRNFPPSFWNSNYQPPVSFSNFSDPYMTSFHSMSSFTQDPWRYPFSSQTHSAYAHPTFPDFSSYGSHMASAASNRFNTQFSSLMPSAAAAAASKLGSLGQYDFTKHATDSWPTGRYHSDMFGASSSLQASHHQDPYGLYSGALTGTC